MTTNLLLDLGNSRLKWAIDRDGMLDVGAAIGHREDGIGDLSALFAASEKVESAWLSSTALSLTAVLVTAIESHYGCSVQTFVAPKEALGIRSAYDEPSRLGADRFLAMVGARSHVDGAFLIADAGTALTLDMVDRGGQHLGGLIAPGPVLMREALHRGTAGVRTAPALRVREFARNTDDAVWSGGCLACVALIEHAWRHGALGVGGDVELLLCGGATPLLQPQLRIPQRHLPNLVLDGLAQWARAA
jgi:type III pantothenate kinase